MNEKTAHIYKERTRMKTEIEIIDKPKRNKVIRQTDKVLTLDQIEEKMIELATSPTTDIMEMMMNEKKIGMLEKVANLKMHRLQIKALEQEAKVVEAKPLEVRFISSKTEEQKARLERIDKEICENRNLKPNA